MIVTIKTKDGDCIYFSDVIETEIEETAEVTTIKTGDTIAIKEHD